MILNGFLLSENLHGKWYSLSKKYHRDFVEAEIILCKNKYSVNF